MLLANSSAAPSREDQLRGAVGHLQDAQRRQSIFRGGALVAVEADVVDEELVMVGAQRLLRLHFRELPRAPLARGRITLRQRHEAGPNVRPEQDAAPFAEQLRRPGPGAR